MNALSFTPFRAALAFEILSNIASLPGTFSNPDNFLSMFVQSPSQITASFCFMTRVLGCVVAGLTIPLILCWPTPVPGPKGQVQRGFRRATYVAMSGFEIFTAGLSGFHLLNPAIDSGLTHNALFGIFTAMTAILGMRAFFLVLKPEWLSEDTTSSTKAE